MRAKSFELMDAMWGHDVDPVRRSRRGDMADFDRRLLDDFVPPMAGLYYCAVQTSAASVGLIGVRGAWWVMFPSDREMAVFGHDDVPEPARTTFLKLFEPIWNVPMCLPTWLILERSDAVSTAWSVAVGHKMPSTEVTIDPPRTQITTHLS